MKSISATTIRPGDGILGRAWSALRRRGRLGWMRGVLLCGVTTAWGAAVPSAQFVHQVKAAYIFNFAKYVEWPADRFESGASPIVIGVLATGTVGEELRRIVKDRQINGRDILVKTVGTPVEIRSVHILFVGVDEGSRFGEMAETLRRDAILTVGESPKFTGAGGMISFVLQGNNVRFEINQGAAEEAGLRISSQLLKLATEVRKKN